MYITCFLFRNKFFDRKERRGLLELYFSSLGAPASVSSKSIFVDILSSHYSPRVAEAAGHSILPKPLYAPQDGPIEYAF